MAINEFLALAGASVGAIVGVAHVALAQAPADLATTALTQTIQFGICASITIFAVVTSWMREKRMTDRINHVEEHRVQSIVDAHDKAIKAIDRFSTVMEGFTAEQRAIRQLIESNQQISNRLLEILQQRM